MPVMLDRESISLWLNKDTETSSLSGSFIDQLAHDLTARPVDKAINNCKAKIAPISIGSDVELIN